jgi:hypothetical protein
VVRVDSPAVGKARAGDEQPAEVTVDFDRLLHDVSPGRVPDLGTLQVIRQDPATGQPVVQSPNAYGKGPADLPWRWYDAAIGYEFPEFEGNVDVTEGKLNFVRIPRFGYFYDCIGDWKSGHLAFPHRTDKSGPAWYGLYFDLLPAGAAPEAVEPRGWVGDGLNRCEPVGTTSTGLIHSRVDAADWNGDGLVDLVVGCARGGVVCYPNRGRSIEPRYPFSKLLVADDGMPVDIGWSATPKIADWDGDGKIDLVVGAEWNRVVWYRNTGTNSRPVLSYQGLIRTEDGKPLFLPWEPSPETEKYFKYARDYYPVLDVTDWDGDGDSDLLAGGYVTGRIYLFQNDAGGGRLPRLHLVGPLSADGQPLDTEWCASPTTGDIDGDGDLDLVSGSMPMTAGGGDASSSDKFLYFFRNDGSRTRPQLHRVPLPCQGQLPSASIGTPRLADYNGDGLLDLVVSSGTQIYLYPNVGTRTAPRFAAGSEWLPSRWSNSPMPATQILDWDGDGLADAIDAPSIYRNQGRGSPGVYDKPFSVLAPGQTISHRSGIGDDWVQPRLYDLDGDGRIDYMDADHPGHFWWHRNQGTQAKPRFDSRGVQLLLTGGEPVSIGAGLEGFDALQGARATYTVGDFNRDGLPDLIAVNTLGTVCYFRQGPRAGGNEPPRFEPGVQIGKLVTRGAPYAADWDGDGRLDVIVAADADNTFVFAGNDRDAARPFAEGRKLVLPRAPFGSGGPLVVADLNGDGDPDVLLHTAYGYTCLYEHSFIESGYARGTVIVLQSRGLDHGDRRKN